LKGMIDLSELYEPPMEPENMRFVAEPAKSCRGCCFKRQRAAVCDKANAVAIRAGLPACEAGGVIYVLAKIDPRQIDFVADQNILK
jgi:hypothetical protein